MVVGCGDGSLKLYDIRIAQKSGVTAQLDGHKGWILNATIPTGNIHTIASGDTSGEVKFWDCRAPSTPKMTYHIHKNGEMTSFTVHNYTDIFCTFVLFYFLCFFLVLVFDSFLYHSGTQNQRIRLADCRNGKEITSIRYHDGLILGQRIGPVGSLAFHPFVFFSFFFIVFGNLTAFCDFFRYKLVLAAGATDSIISMYRAS